MKYKTLFRMLIKAIGVWLAVNGVASAIGGISMALNGLLSGGGITTFNLGTMYWLVSPLAQMGIGLYLFFRGGWISDLAFPGDRPYCQECGYDLTGNASGRCPECGTDWSKDYTEERVRSGVAVVEDKSEEAIVAAAGSIAKWVPWCVMGVISLMLLWGIFRYSCELLMGY